MKKLTLLLFILTSLVASSQNVGIGTTNPTRAKLEIHGAVDATSAIFGGESSGISIQRNWPGIGFNTYYGNGAHRYLSNGHGGVLSLDPTNGFLIVDMFGPGQGSNGITFPNRAMVISKEGWVTIGSALAPTASLRVARGVSFDGTAMLEGTKYPSYFNKGTDEHTYIRAGRDNGIVYINDIAGGKVNLHGNVGINTTALNFPLEIKQTFFDKGIQFGILETTWGIGLDNTGGLRFLCNGNFIGQFLSSNGAYQSVSDKRLKTNIQSLPTALPKIMHLNPVSYDMGNIKSSRKTSIGFLAQEVAEIFPELVNIIKDTAHGYDNISDLYTLDYNGFAVLAIKAVQEQQSLIQSLQNEIAELKKAIAELRTNGTANDPVLLTRKAVNIH